MFHLIYFNMEFSCSWKPWETTLFCFCVTPIYVIQSNGHQVVLNVLKALQLNTAMDTVFWLELILCYVLTCIPVYCVLFVLQYDTWLSYHWPSEYHANSSLCTPYLCLYMLDVAHHLIFAVKLLVCPYCTYVQETRLCFAMPCSSHAWATLCYQQWSWNVWFHLIFLAMSWLGVLHVLRNSPAAADSWVPNAPEGAIHFYDFGSAPYILACWICFGSCAILFILFTMN